MLSVRWPVSSELPLRYDLVWFLVKTAFTPSLVNALIKKRFIPSFGTRKKIFMVIETSAPSIIIVSLTYPWPTVRKCVFPIPMTYHGVESKA